MQHSKHKDHGIWFRQANDRNGVPDGGQNWSEMGGWARRTAPETKVTTHQEQMSSLGCDMAGGSG